MSISVDPATGLKVFNTRAASAMEDVVGRGYSVVEGEALTTAAGAEAFNTEEQARYREYKEARPVRSTRSPRRQPGRRRLARFRTSRS